MTTRPSARARRRLLVVVLGLLLSIIPSAHASADRAAEARARYRIVDLGTLPGGANSEARAINDDGDIVGYSETADGLAHAVRWRGGAITDLGTLPGAGFSVAYDINGHGEIVGQSGFRAFLWRDGVMTDLGTLGTSSVAYAINDLGQVVGESMNSSGESHVFLWEDGRMTDLGIITGSIGSEALSGINDLGQIAGTVLNGDAVRAFRWDRGVLQDLGDLGFGISLANGINGDGHVTGMSGALPSGSFHAFLWRDGRMIDLGTLTGSENGESYGRDLNDRDQVVGYSITASGSTHAFLWQRGRMSDLGSIQAGEFDTNSQAEDINTAGEIVGTSGVTAFGQRHAVLWTRR